MSSGEIINRCGGEHDERQACAKRIAEYITDTGTANTFSGSWHIDFSEINERYDVRMPDDKEMLDMIVAGLDRSIVADIDTAEDFDIVFYTGCCPNYSGADLGNEEILY